MNLVCFYIQKKCLVFCLILTLIFCNHAVGMDFVHRVAADAPLAGGGNLFLDEDELGERRNSALKKISKETAKFAAGASVSFITSIFAHEAGHAIADSKFFPGSLKAFNVCGIEWDALNRKFKWNVSLGYVGYVQSDAQVVENVFKKNPRLGKYKWIICHAAGPVAGLGYTYGVIKGLQVHDEYYRNGQGLKIAIEKTVDKPLLYEIGNHKAIAFGVIVGAMLDYASFFTYEFRVSDGGQILRDAVGESLYKSRLVRASWNSAVVLGGCYVARKMVNDCVKAFNLKITEDSILSQHDSNRKWRKKDIRDRMEIAKNWNLILDESVTPDELQKNKN